MADRDVGKGSVSKNALKPLNAGKIEMIGRLVEEQNIRRLHQRFRDAETLAPPTRQFDGRGFKVRKAGFAEGFRHSRRTLFGGDARVFEGLFNDRAHGVAGGKVGNLANIAHAGALARRNSPSSGLTRPQRISSSVDLPAPLGPISPIRSPSDTVNETF